MLCESCRKLFFGLNTVRRSQGRQTIHHSSKRSLRLALRQKCIVCRAEYYGVRGWSSMKSEAGYIRRTGSNYVVLLEMHGSIAPGDISKKSTVFWITRINPRCDRLLIKGYQPSTYTGSDACFSLARHWNRTCHMGHTSCERPRATDDSNWNPTRLIKIDPQSNYLKLCQGDMLRRPVEYAALSHCWGDIKDKIVLTSEKLLAFQKELPDLQRLQTFQHAIIAAKKLGFQYIWIDSLCIIQGSDEDWSKEASLMSSVYKYATLTITATSATDDTEGCFFNRDIKNYFPTRISVEAGNGNGRRQYAHRARLNVNKI
ncbi:Heterokaryon incompatibility protein (HET) domain containing protein [Hyaloscypha variabilis]